MTAQELLQWSVAIGFAGVILIIFAVVARWIWIEFR